MIFRNHACKHVVSFRLCFFPGIIGWAGVRWWSPSFVPCVFPRVFNKRCYSTMLTPPPPSYNPPHPHTHPFLATPFPRESRGQFGLPAYYIINKDVVNIFVVFLFGAARKDQSPICQHDLYVLCRTRRTVYRIGGK